MLLLAGAGLGAVVEVGDTPALRDALNSASPGDRIVMRPGSYEHLYVSEVHGTAEALIEVVAKDPAHPPVFSGSQGFQLYQSSYVLVDGIVVSGCTDEGVHFGFSDHIVLRNVVSTDMPGAVNADTFKMDGCNDLLFHNCAAANWSGGSGFDFVGCRDVLITRTTLTYPGGGSNGIQPKGGSFNMAFYKNRLNDAGSRAQQFGGSTGDQYYHQGNRELGWEAYDQVAMGNVITQSDSAVAYVSCTDCNFAYNTVVDPRDYILRILKEGGDHPTAEDTFARNLIVYGPLNGIVNVGSNTLPATFTYAENYWYKWSNPAQSIPTLPAPEINPAGGTDPQLDADYRPLYDGAKDYGAHAPAMEAAFEDYVSWFQWAWDWAQVFEPKAAPGGPYEVGPGGSITLDASASYAGAGSYGAYSFDSLQWDLDRDGSYDAAGRTIQIPYEYLTLLGLGFGSHLVELKATVTNEYNTLWDLGWAELVLVNHPALAGDANADNVVDGLDYNAWSLHYLESGHPAWADGGWSVGNFNADDVVDGLDYNAWSLNYAPEAAAVPEPSCGLLLMAGIWAIKRRRHKT
ncbi:MAG: hypothetical protein AMJ81_04290 [Phycisphaerae bacterium SM23_33]|nr:MAG: hypothetical protein AMJ81_04290 [Phycisphaerae bacterium SM23_33]